MWLLSMVRLKLNHVNKSGPVQTPRISKLLRSSADWIYRMFITSNQTARDGIPQVGDLIPYPRSP